MRNCQIKYSGNNKLNSQSPIFIRALIAFVSLPGIFALLLPPLIARFDPWKGRHITPGIIILLTGAVIVLWCVGDFFITGKGTLAPWDPPKRLIIAGLYRYVRNPMYIGVLVTVFGWCVYFFSPLLFLYNIILFTAFHLRVIIYEEPHLKEQFGREWDDYSRKVPRWFPHFDFHRGNFFNDKGNR